MRLDECVQWPSEAVDFHFDVMNDGVIVDVASHECLLHGMI